MNARDAFEQRRSGSAATGMVELRDFDVGIIRALSGGYTLIENEDATKGRPGIFVDGIPNICPPDGYPGVPIIFGDPEDASITNALPSILVKRDDISSAKERWQPEAMAYSAPAPGAVPLQVTTPKGQILYGFDRREILPQAEPFDIMYTVSARARFRGTTQRNNANALFKHILRMFPPYGSIVVEDSIGDCRRYAAFNEGITNLDAIADIQDRMLGYALTIRVEAELDLNDPGVVPTVKVPLTVSLKRI